jgi:hypothetical protein
VPFVLKQRTFFKERTTCLLPQQLGSAELNSLLTWHGMPLLASTIS